MAAAKINPSQYLVVEIDTNIITEKGCSYLSRAQWKRLQRIDLSCLFLTQIAIKLLIWDANLFLKGSGLNYPLLISVLLYLLQGIAKYPI